MKKWLKRLGYTILIIFIFLNIVAAFHAYKFTHFSDTKVSIMKKAEQMSAWERTKVVLFGVDYAKLKITDSPSHPFQTFHIKTSDNVLLEGWYVPEENAKGTVVMFHGHAGCRSGIVKEANAFYDLGYSVCLIDFRAHGNSEGNICTIGYNEGEDVHAAYKFIEAKGEQNIVLWGISLGAASITRAMAVHEDMKPTKVILEMPFGSLYGAVKGRLRTMHLPEQPFSSLLTFWGGVERGFNAFENNPSDYAESIHVPVLLQWGKHDARVSENETNELFTNLGTSKKNLVVYYESGHQSLLKNEPEKWCDAVEQFLENK